jgi:uncharacterized membrane protein YbjE (DUF340 family)
MLPYEAGHSPKFVNVNTTAMKQNIGLSDRIIRVSIALLIIIFYFTNLIDGVTANILLVLAATLAITSSIGWCPLYGVIRLSPRKKAQSLD